MSKKVKIKIINMALIIYFVIAIIKNIFIETRGVNLASFVTDSKSLVLLIIYIILGCSYITFLSNWWILAVYIGTIHAIKKHSKERLDEVDFKNKEIYYRDIIKKYSPGVLNYIDNFCVTENTIYATIMSLQLKNKLNSEMEVINSDVLDLDTNEKYIFEIIKNRQLQNIKVEEYANCVIEDCKKHKLIKEKNKKFKFLEKSAIIILISFCMTMFSIIGLSLSILNLDNGERLGNGIVRICIFGIIGGMFGFFYAIVYAISYNKKNTAEPYIRTTEAKEINENLEGLKNYIKEYSFIDERSAQSLDVWADYLIYSVIFNMNYKVIEEYNVKIKNILK